jgi:hypothetical protein
MKMSNILGMFSKEGGPAKKLGATGRGGFGDFLAGRFSQTALGQIMGNPYEGAGSLVQTKDPRTGLATATSPTPPPMWTTGSAFGKFRNKKTPQTLEELLSTFAKMNV